MLERAPEGYLSMLLVISGLKSCFIVHKPSLGVNVHMPSQSSQSRLLWALVSNPNLMVLITTRRRKLVNADIV